MFTKHVIKQLSAYCNRELSADQSRYVREHLLTCERCRREHGEVKLGVQLAQQLPLAQAPAEMWSEIEALLDEGSRKPVFQPKAPRLVFAFSWYRVAAFGAGVMVAVAIGLMWSSYYGPRAAWVVDNIVGNVRIGGDHTIDIGSLAVGETLETDSSSRARINVAMIGEVEVDPNTRIRLVQTRLTEHRLALDRGRIHAKISAPPRLFFVDTPSAEAIDLGCAYTLEVDDAGRGLLHVTLGEVALVRNGREVYVPRYAMCQTRPGIGPGTPYFEDASEAFVRALEKFDFEDGAQEAFSAVLKESRPRDTFTLWHLLSRVEGDQRVQVLDRMIELVGLPQGVTREGTLQLDQKTLDTWKDEMDTVWF
ncbi:MAG: zf-HC2 domain-containing protein [Acidobacteriota bacterium]